MNDSGFTLLELVIVMTLRVLFLGLSGVHFANRLSSAKLDGTARELSGLIRMGRIEAMSAREERRVTIDLNRRTYGLKGAARRAVPEGVAISVVDPVRGAVHGGAYDIIADASGPVGSCAIILGTKKKTFRIEIDPVIGSVVVKNYGQEN